MSAKAKYALWASDPRGSRFRSLEFTSWFRVLMAANSPGWFEIALPLDIIQKRDNELELFLRLDGVFEIRRKAAGSEGSAELISGFARNFWFSSNNLVISGPGLGDLLKRRVIPYPAGGSYASKTGEADDLMKEIVRENLGGNATDSNRDLTALGFGVESDRTLGPSVVMNFAYDNVLDTLRNVAEAADEAGTKTFFRIARVEAGGEMEIQFQTTINQPGQDRTLSGDAPLVLGEEWGNLSVPNYVLGYNDEVNYVYGGGQGERANREVVEVSDAGRISSSPWNRREGFVNASGQASTTAGYTEIANQVLADGNPRVSFSGQIQDTDTFGFGKDWFFGDKVSAVYRNRQFDGIVDLVEVIVNSDGEETINASIRVSDVI